jgi:hypothetical protein
MTARFSFPRRRIPAAFPTLLRAAASGVLLGLTSTACVISIHDDGDDWGSDQEECFDEYGDCMDDADEPSEFDACESQLDVCLDGYADDEAGDGDDGTTGDGDADSGDDAPPHADSGDGDPPHADSGDDQPPHADSGDDDPPHADDTTGDGDADSDEGDDYPPADDTTGEGDADSDDGDSDDGGGDTGSEIDCFELFATCIGAAQNLLDIEICTAEFELCLDPGGCHDPECGCPQ